MRSKLSVVVTVLAVSITLVSATPSAAVTSAAGRVTLQNPIRVVDTRSASGVRTTGPVGLTGLGFVYLDDALEPGTASIYPCAGAPGPDPSLIFEAHETVYTKVASSQPMCIVSSTPVFLVEDSFGSVAANAFVGGLQYVPLATPTVVFDGETPPPDPASPLISPTTHFAIGPQPGSARAAVLLLEALDPTDPGFASVSQCSQPSLTADLSWSNRRAVGISYAPVAQGSSDFCFRSSGSTTLRVTLLGYLQSDGPDPTSLPPTLSYPFHPDPPPGLRPTTPGRLLDTRQSTAARVA